MASLRKTQADMRFGTVYYSQSEGMSHYNALTTTVTKRFGGGSVTTAAYTHGIILTLPGQYLL